MTNKIRDAPSESVRNLAKTYEGLEWSERGGLNGGKEYLFVKVHHDNDVAPPATLPSIKHADSIYFLIPGEIGLPNHWEKKASPYLAEDTTREGVAFIPEAEDWPDDAEIIKALDAHRSSVFDAQHTRELLERERRPSAGLYASAVWIDQETPMLIEGFMRERGVSVFYGAFDEFKTTLVLDMVAHVAMGAPWQGRKVEPRPVIWYALEGKEEIPVRLKALEASLKGKDTAWGDDGVPITVFDRIPEDYRKWRTQICRIAYRWGNISSARKRLNDFEMTERNGFARVEAWERDDTIDTITIRTVSDSDELPEDFRGYIIFKDELYTPNMEPVYPHQFIGEGGVPPVVVIDTLSLALGGEDEKGPKAAGFINDCLDLLKERPDMGNPYDSKTDPDKFDEWDEENSENADIIYPVAAHVIVIHHQTKTGIDFAGHRAIAANTQGLYRVHRFGKITDAERPYAGQLTPQRVKGIPRPSPIRFEVDVVPVEGTKQTAAILKDMATAIPKELKPIIEALRELDDLEEIPLADLNECLDVVAAKGAKNAAAKRKARQRSRDKLEAAGVIEPVEDENGKVEFYRFHNAWAA